MKRDLLLTSLVMLLLTLPPRAAAQQAPPSAQDLADSVAARYAAMQTYRDEGNMRVDITGQEPSERRFVTFFDRQRGLKVDVVGTVPGREQRDVIWDDLRCVRTYANHRGEESLTECRRLDEYRRVAIEGIFLVELVQRLIWEWLLPRSERSAAVPSWVQVEESRREDGRLLYALVDRSGPRTGRTTWIDAASRHIVRYEQRWEIGQYQQLLLQVLTVDYLVVEIDGPIPAEALRFHPPFYLTFRTKIQQIAATTMLPAVVVSAVFLGIQAAAMYWLGHLYRRRAAFEMGAIVVRAGLWSLILSWTLLVAYGHGVAVFVLPAWLVLGSQIGWYLGFGEIPTRYVWFSPYGGVPAAWLSIACSLCAYVVGALRRRPQSSYGA